ncbi:terminase large subunit domain-containing protein [Clostridium kluyveri]|uniref:Terminase n=1 Tax=Clostridium kluyveri TaxID=1534 RepID=A0A1L5F4Q0_CLOKL|nr:terminase family protein [Clostridium kluyveri]APM37810.1 terminase [Clostridium kluyveri]
MGINKENALKLQYLWQDGHEAEWIESFIKIADKDSNIVPFILTQQQREFVENMSKYNIILKSRQLGFSLVICALSIRKCIIKPYSNCLLMSAEQKSATEIFDKLKIMYDNLPDWLRPENKAYNRQQIKMDNGSKITCCCEGRKEIVGATNIIVHLSEFSRWSNPQKQLSSIQKTVVADGFIIIESTANGFNFFSDLWFKSKNFESDFKPFFFNWINGRELFEKDYKNSVERFKARNNGKSLTENELDAEEQNLLKMGAELDQLMWRRLEIMQCGVDLFHQDRPANDTEAFLLTGSNLFDTKRVTEVAIAIPKNNYIPKDNITDLPVLLKQYYGKSFFIYKIKKSTDKIYIGIDMSEGVGRDYCACEIFNQDGEQIAEFYNNKLKPYKMAEIINTLGLYYNKALLNIETASGGLSVIENLRNYYRYMNMYKQKMFNEYKKVVYKLGFDTNGKTKGQIINNFIEMFDTGQVQINSRRLLEEMQFFEIKENGSMGAVQGHHDDCLMAASLSLHSLKHGFMYKW